MSIHLCYNSEFLIMSVFNNHLTKFLKFNNCILGTFRNWCHALFPNPGFCTEFKFQPLFERPSPPLLSKRKEELGDSGDYSKRKQNI